jgi:hypothetical protein
MRWLQEIKKCVALFGLLDSILQVLVLGHEGGGFLNVVCFEEREDVSVGISLFL